MGAAQKLVDKEILRSLVPLNALSDAHFHELMKRAKIEEITSGYYLFKKGDRDNRTYFILSGEVALMQGRKQHSVVRATTEESLHPIAPQQPRQFTAKTKGRTTVMHIDSGLLDVMLTWDQSSGSGYEVSDIHSEEDEDWMTRMLQSELLVKLPALNIQQLIMSMEEVEAKSGDLIVRQDEEGDYYYIIKEGICVVARKLSERGKPVKLAELNEGASFGEEALLSGGNRNASIIMKTDGVLMRLSKKDFDEILKAPLIEKVSYKEGKKMVSKGAVWLDVRLPGEYSNGHIPGSINIPLAAIRDDSENLDANKKYVVYCDTRRRSSSAIFLLGQRGLDGCILTDGLSAVPHNDLEASKGSRVTSADVIQFNQLRPNQESTVLENRDKESRLELEKSRQTISIQQERMEAIEHDLIKKEEELSAKEEALFILRSEVEKNIQLQEDANRLQAELESALAASSELEEKLINSMSSGASFEEELSSLTSRLNQETQEHWATVTSMEEKEEQLLQHQQAVNDLQQQVEQIQEEKTSLQTKLLEEGSIRKVLEKDQKNQAANLGNESNELRERLDEQEEAGQQVEQHLASLEQELAQKVEILESTETELSSLRKQLEETSEIQNTLDVEIEARQQIEQQLEITEQKYTEAYEALEYAEHEIEALESRQGESSDAQESTDIERNKRKELEAKLDSLEGEFSLKKAELESTESEFAELQSQLERSSEVQKSLATEVEARQEVELQLESQGQELVDAQKALTEAKKEVTVFGFRLNRFSSVHENLEAEQKEKESLSKRLETLDKDAEKARTDLELANEEISRLNSVQEEVLDIQKTLDEEQKDKESLSKRLETLDKDAEKARTDLELANEEVSRLKSAQEEVLDIQKTLDAETEIRKKAENTLDSFREESEQGEAALVEATEELGILRSEFGDSSEDLLGCLLNLKEENKALEEQVENISTKANKERDYFLDETDSWKSMELEFNTLKSDADILAQQLEEVTLGKGNLRKELSDQEEEMKQIVESEEAARKHAEAETDRLHQELENMKNKEEQQINLRSELEEELDKLAADLEQANTHVSDIDKELSEAQDSNAAHNKEIDSLQSELGQSKGVIEEAKALREEVEGLKRSYSEEKDSARIEDDSLNSDLKEENEVLRSELEKIYREQEIAIETGRAPKPPKPLDIPNLFGEEDKGSKEPSTSTQKSAEPVRVEKARHDPFVIADVDKKSLQFGEESSKGRKKVVIYALLAVVLILIPIGAAYYFLLKPHEGDILDKGLGKTESNKTDSIVSKQGSRSGVNEQKSAIGDTDSKTVEKKIASAEGSGQKTGKFSTPAIRKKTNAQKIENRPETKVKLMAAGKTFSEALKIGGRGPVMVKVPKGTFEMGSASSSTYFDERPRHKVKIKAFSISKYEVTFKEYDRYAEAAGVAKPDDNGWGRGRRPVINVSLNDAVAYAKWLSTQTGYVYRLPSEAEWEYAARAGSSTLYWWGTLFIENKANCFNCGGKWDGESTAPVGKFKANSLGLYDVSGNVMEWTQDCYHKNYQKAPVNGSAWNNGSCVSRMLRGGSYRTTAVNLRISKRDHLPSEVSADNVGFRLVRSNTRVRK